MSPAEPPPTKQPPDESSDSAADNTTDKWVLTKEAFDKLLEHFSTDREEAGRRYGVMQAKMIRYFEGRSSPSPQDLAVTTMNRVARRIQQGEKIFNLGGYFYKVAELVWMENRKRPGLIALEDLPEIPTEPPKQDDQKEARLRCLDECLDKLPVESRKLILEYYQDEKRAKIDHRQQLARESTINALRIRACRIRKNLEKCVKDCLGQFT